MRREEKTWIWFVALPLALFFAIYFAINARVPVSQRLVTQQAEVDLYDADFRNGLVYVSGEVEYVAGELLTPEQFALREDIQQGRPWATGMQVYTSRFFVRLPPGHQYMFLNYNRSFGDRIYVNGEEAVSVGVPSETEEHYVPDDAMVFFAAEPRGPDGLVEVVTQSSNYVHRDGHGAADWYVGTPRYVAAHMQQSAGASAFLMGWMLLMFVVHMVLYGLQRTYPANLWFSLLCLVGFVRVGVTDVKLLRQMLPFLDWRTTFRLEYMCMPLIVLLVVLSVREMFPGALPRRTPLAVGLGTVAFTLFYLFADTVLISRTLLATELFVGGTGLFVVACLLARVRRPNLEQKLVASAIGVLLLSFLLDTFYYASWIPHAWMPTTLSEPAICLYVLLCMCAVLYGTMHNMRIAIENQQNALAEAEEARRETRRMEQLHGAAPEGHRVTRGILTLDTLARQAYLDNKDMLLSPTEFALLSLLVQNEGQVLTREKLFESVWKRAPVEDTKVVWTHISNLKKKLEMGSGEKLSITTVRGKGYTFYYGKE